MHDGEMMASVVAVTACSRRKSSLVLGAALLGFR